MIRVVLDVNVLVSGFPAPGGVPAALIDRWLRREYEVVISDPILDGIARAWQNAYFSQRYLEGEQVQALALLRTRAMMVTPVATVRGVAEDEEDDLVLATAVSGRASYLVTGDRRLREIGEYDDVTICTPREFLTVLDDRGADRS